MNIVVSFFAILFCVGIGLSFEDHNDIMVWVFIGIGLSLAGQKQSL